MIDKHFYYYLHINGQLIYKNAFSVDSIGASEYFEGGFVKKYWKLKTREDVDIMLSEAIELGANVSSVDQVVINLGLKEV